ncbi:MAG: methionyl-tRNA formyltransferase [bacterium]
MTQTGPQRRLRTVFLGTPAFAVPALRAVAPASTVLAVVTQPDRPKGRGRQVAAPPVAEAARALGIPVLQPARLKSPDVVAQLALLAPDVLVTVAYGRIIPREILTLPPLGGINLHPSLLPKYRGASPIPRAIEAGETVTGVTIMYQSEALDAGDIILQREVPIDPADTALTLEEKLARVGADALVDALALIAADQAPRRPQDHDAATYVGKLTKEDGRIEWARPAAALANFVRAMDPWPSAYTTHRGRLLKIWKAEDRSDGGGATGTITELRPGEGFMVATGGGGLLVTIVQPEGRRRMTADEYARGARLEVGERLV